MTRPSSVIAAAWRCRPSERTARCHAESGRASTASPRRKRRMSSASAATDGIAIGRRLRRRLADDGARARRDGFAEGVDERLALAGAGLRQHVGERLAADRPLQRHELEQDQAQRALVALGVELVVASVRLFGRHVERRADDGAVRRLAVARLGADLGAADGAGPGGARERLSAGRRRGSGRPRPAAPSAGRCPSPSRRPRCAGRPSGWPA